jgi:hypothetical protein
VSRSGGRVPRYQGTGGSVPLHGRKLQIASRWAIAPTALVLRKSYYDENRHSSADLVGSSGVIFPNSDILANKFSLYSSLL